MKKEDLFDVTENGKYVVTKFKYIAPNSTLRVNLSMFSDQWHQSQEDADKYMDAVVYCIKNIGKLDKTYDPMLIVATHLNMIESWTCPITVISKFTIDELSLRVYERFVDGRKVSKERIESLIARKTESVDALNAKEEEELYVLNDVLEYGLSEEFVMSRMSKSLDEMLRLTGEMLELLKKDDK